MSIVVSNTERETVERLIRRTVYAPVRGAGPVAVTVARLGEAIGHGLLHPGDRLPPETQLAADLGISAVSLRSALVVLRSAGLVETRRGRLGGTFVTSHTTGAAFMAITPATASDPESLRDLATERAAVEGVAAALAARNARPEQLDLLTSIANGMQGLRSFDLWNQRANLLHLVIGDASGSLRLTTRIAKLRAETYRISKHLPIPHEVLAISNRDHLAIVHEIRAHQPERARDAMERHIIGVARIQAGSGRLSLTDDDDETTSAA